MAEPADGANAGYDELIAEMGTQFFDTIRFASYRTACKIRFVQKKTSFHLVDIWNAVEAIRESGLATISESDALVPSAKLQQLLDSIFGQLNKRLPPSQHIDQAASVRSLYSFLTYAYDRTGSGQLSVFAIKVALSSLSAGRLQDKLRYLFSLVSDVSSGLLIPSLFQRLLRELLQLACSVREQQFYQFDEQLVNGMFAGRAQSVTAKEFQQLFYTASGPPPILSWFVIIHKMAQVQNTVHQCACSCCGRSGFVGFRYKCQKCFHYNLCELCFWQGKATGSHNAETHSCKEYLHWKSAGKQLGDSLRRSFRLKSGAKQRMELHEEPVTQAKQIILGSPVHAKQQPAPGPAGGLEVTPTLDAKGRPTGSPARRLPQRFLPATPCSPIRLNVNGSEFDLNRSVGAAAYQPANSTLINGYQLCGPSYATDLYAGRQVSSPANSHRCRPPAYGGSDVGFPPEEQFGELGAFQYGLDEEHRLIARYAANLAVSGSVQNLLGEPMGSSSSQNFTATNSCSSNLAHLTGLDVDFPLEPSLQQQEQLIGRLESKNREIMREIVRLREFSPSSDYNSLTNSYHPHYNSLGRSSGSSSGQSQLDLLDELAVLRDRKDELETHLESLHDSRRELKGQLEHLIKLSKNYGALISSPASASSSLSQASGRRMQQMLGEHRKHTDQVTSAIAGLVGGLNDDDEFIMKQIRLAHSIEDKLKLTESSGANPTGTTNAAGDLPQKVNGVSRTAAAVEERPGRFNGESSKSIQSNGQSRATVGSNGSFAVADANGSDKSRPNGQSQALDETTKRRGELPVQEQEKIEHNNILNRNIDLILNGNRSSAQRLPRRPNKYMSQYGLKQEPTDQSTLATSRLSSSEAAHGGVGADLHDACSSDANSISSGSQLTSCEIKSQPPMCFSSIEYVNANRQMQQQQLHQAQLQHNQKLLGYGRHLPQLPLDAQLVLSTTDEEEEEEDDDELNNDVDSAEARDFFPATDEELESAENEWYLHSQSSAYAYSTRFGI